MPETHPPYEMLSTEIRTIYSKHVDQEYKLFIHLPFEYAETEANYPVLYMGDGNWNFPIMRFYSFYPIQPFITVGIGYPTDDFAEIYRLRSRDFLPTKNAQEEVTEKEQFGLEIESGGGEKFLSFIREELIPFMEEQYRVKSDERAFFGHSWGGTFGLYCLFNQPDVFQRYLLAAPELGWDSGISFSYESDYAKNSSDLPAKVYLAVGLEDETLKTPFVSDLVRFHTLLKSRKYPNLELKLDVMPKETHGTIVIASVHWGLRELFKPD